MLDGQLDKIAQQAVMKTFLGKGLFLSVAPSVLQSVGQSSHCLNE